MGGVLAGGEGILVEARMSGRKVYTLALMTWSKFFVYILPLAWTALLPPILSMIPVLASIGWGIRKSRTRFEKGCGMAMIASWLVWGWHAGLWVEYDRRQGWQVLVASAVLYALVEESDYQHRLKRSRDEWE
jgi:hypothetical protein